VRVREQATKRHSLGAKTHENAHDPIELTGRKHAATLELPQRLIDLGVEVRRYREASAAKGRVELGFQKRG